jgi:hypothetical protein
MDLIENTVSHSSCIVACWHIDLLLQKFVLVAVAYQCLSPLALMLQYIGHDKNNEF